MGLFGKKKDGVMNIIRCDEPSYLIWKWRPAGKNTGDSQRENAIRWGSILHVKDGEVAVFVYNQNNGVMQDYIEGPFERALSTLNLPVLSSIIGLAYAGDSPFQAEVYFINLAHIIQTRFAVPYFNVFDPRYPDFGVPVAARGTISYKISDYRSFIQLHRLREFTLEEFAKQIKDAMSRYVKDTISQAPAAHNIPVVQIETRIAQINDVIELDVKERLKDSFGVDVSSVDIGAIEIDKTGEEYQKLMAVTRDVTEATVQAQTGAGIKDIYDKQRIEAENYEESLRIQREEGQYAQHKQTETNNMAAYQIEKQAEVGIAGANALGQMGANGASSVNLSGDGTGLNPAAMMAGVAMGGAIGQNMAGMMNNMMSGLNAAPQAQTGIVPPPIPVEAYHIAVNGQATGPYSKAELSQMVLNGNLKKDTLVWKQGMANWAKAESLQELADVFATVPPPLPNE